MKSRSSRGSPGARPSLLGADSHVWQTRQTVDISANIPHINVSSSADYKRRRSANANAANTSCNAGSFVDVFQTNTDEHSATRTGMPLPSNNDRSLGQLGLGFLHHLRVSGCAVRHVGSGVHVEAECAAATWRVGAE